MVAGGPRSGPPRSGSAARPASPCQCSASPSTGQPTGRHGEAGPPRSSSSAWRPASTARRRCRPCSGGSPAGCHPRGQRWEGLDAAVRGGASGRVDPAVDLVQAPEVDPEPGPCQAQVGVGGDRLGGERVDPAGDRLGRPRCRNSYQCAVISSIASCDVAGARSQCSIASWIASLLAVPRPRARWSSARARLRVRRVRGAAARRTGGGSGTTRASSRAGRRTGLRARAFEQPLASAMPVTAAHSGADSRSRTELRPGTRAFWRLAIEHLVAEIVDDLLVIAGEGVDEAATVLAALQRQPGELEAGRPPLGALVQARDFVAVEVKPHDIVQERPASVTLNRRSAPRISVS